MKRNILSFCLSVLATFSFGLASNLPTPSIKGTIESHDIAVNGDKVYYACAVKETEKQLQVFEYTQNSWHEILTPVECKVGGVIDLKVFNGMPYILFQGYQGLNLIKYKNSQWYTVGKLEFASDASIYWGVEFTLVDDTPYVIFENNKTKKADIRVMYTSGNIQMWTEPDFSSQIASSTRLPKLTADNSQNLFMAWTNPDKGIVSVYQCENNSESINELSTKGLNTKGFGEINGVYYTDNQLYMVLRKLSNGELAVYRFNSGSMKWEIQTLPSTLSGNKFVITQNQSAVLHSKDKKLISLEYQNGGWSEGNNLHKTAVKEVQVASNKTNTYVAFLDAVSGKLNIVSY